MTKRDRLAIQHQRQLQNTGYQVQAKRVACRLHTNPQDETARHAHAKLAAGRVLASLGYRVDSEVVHEPTGNIVDVLGYGVEGRNPVVVELETECDDSLKLRNVEKYCHGPVGECYTIGLDGMPENIHGMEEEIRSVIL